VDVPLEGQVSLPVGLHKGQCDYSDSSYYTQICNYLASQAMPAGATESYKKILKKRARNYKVSERLMFYSLAHFTCAQIENDKLNVVILLLSH
jgi:hypothetical protein